MTFKQRSGSGTAHDNVGARAVVCARSVLGGLHHEYLLTHALA